MIKVIMITALSVLFLTPVLCDAQPVQFIKFDAFVIDGQQYDKAQTKPVKNQKTKFYNFDDLLINGQYKKPQVLYTDSRQRVKFERLLKLKRDFLPNLINTNKDPTLR